MNEVNKRFLCELFIEKRVRCCQDIYNKLFYSIWPCESIFKEFLSNTSTEVKINYAKKIYGFFRAFEDVVLPEFTINNVISSQQHDLAMSEGYIPQDHVVHSINLYITGIYLFFNFPLFNRRIISQDLSEKTLCRKIKSFIRKWKIFSLNHDLGYYFEYKIKPGGIVTEQVLNSLSQYKELYSDLIFEYTTRSVARTILIVSFAQRSIQKLQLNSSTENNCTRMWKNKENTVCDAMPVHEMLEEYTTAILLKDIDSEELFAHFILALHKEKVLVEICGDDGCALGYIERIGNSIERLYIIKDSILDESHTFFSENFESLYERIPPKCSLKYYIKDAGEAIYSHLPRDYAVLAKSFYEHLPYFIRTKLSMSTTVSQINECYYEIYKWLSSADTRVLMRAEDEQNFFRKALVRCYEDVIKEVFMLVLNNKINGDSDDKKSDTRAYLHSLVERLAEDDTISFMTEETDKKTAEKYNSENGVPYDMLKYYTQTYKSITRSYFKIEPNKPDEVSLIDALKAVDFIELDERVIVKIFKHPDLLFENNLYKRIKEIAENLNIELDSLIMYSPDHTGGDHGVISAGLIFQAVASANYFKLFSDKLNQLKLAWYGSDGYNTLHSASDTGEYAEVIFAILLHNVYTRGARPNYGIKYTHNIDTEPFSFFCTFCDAFQKWHRDKQLDLSKLDLPVNHFLGDEFDIIVTHDKIKLKCNTQDAKAIRNMLLDEDKFLPGITHFMEVVEY